MIDTPAGISVYQLLARRSALRLWAKTGIQMSRGQSILSICKQAYGLTGNKHAVLEQMDALVDEAQNRVASAT